MSISHQNTRTIATRRRPRLAFPLLLLGGPTLTAILISTDRVAPALAMTVVVLALLALLVGLEYRWPFEPRWQQQSRHDSVTDIIYIAFASLPDRITRLVVEAGAIMLLAFFAASAEPLTTTSMVLRAVAAFVIADLGKYLIHRASHQHMWLWRFHMAHHQPSTLSARNALRVHAVNTAYNAAIDTIPLVLLGVPASAAAVLATLRATIGIVQHANLHLEDGQQWLVNAPSYHRLHHAVDITVANHNYASSLLLWDRWFATLLRGPVPNKIGIAAVDHRIPNGFLGQLFYPFCRERLFTDCALARWVR